MTHYQSTTTADSFIDHLRVTYFQEEFGKELERILIVLDNAGQATLIELQDIFIHALDDTQLDDQVYLKAMSLNLKIVECLEQCLNILIQKGHVKRVTPV